MVHHEGFRSMTNRRPSGFSAFTILWFGQLLSAAGTRMTNFAVSIWVWDATGRATDVVLLLFFAFAATVIFTPIAGALIDRWSRRLTLILTDIGSAAATALLLLFYLTGSVEFWHLYLINFVTGAFLAFQVPVYSATISLMMGRGQYPRANAMMFVVRSTPDIFAPALAAVLLAASSIETVLLIDVFSYLMAIVTVLIVRLPQTPRSPDAQPATLWQDALVGFRFIMGNRYLRNFEALLFAINVFASIGFVLLRPLVLARTGNSAEALGLVMTVGAIGGVIGAVLLATLRSPRDKMLRVLGAIVVFSVVGRILFGIADLLAVLAVSVFFVHLCIPLIDGYTNTIWQEKIEPRMQGRVFAARQFFEDLTVPVGTVIAGPLVDHVLEPWMRPGSGGAQLFGPLVGTGQGAGIGLVFVAVGVLGVVVAAVGFLAPSVRRIEVHLPDHDGLAVPVDPALAAAGPVPRPAPAPVGQERP
jgi:MFS family permease